MVSSINAANHFYCVFSDTNSRLTHPSLGFMIRHHHHHQHHHHHPRRQHFDLKQTVELGFCGFDCGRRSRLIGNPGVLFQGSSSCSGLLARRKRRSEGFEGSGDPGLEAEILEFMQNSGNPSAFPSKKQLIEAGRRDLVEGIVRQGGWLSLGWDVDGDEEIVGESGVPVQDFLNSVSGAKADGNDDDDLGYFDRDDRIFEVRFEGDDSLDASGRIKSSAVSSSSGRGEKVEDDAGIEGILSRLEKERNMSFGICSGENQNKSRVLAPDNQGGSQLEISTGTGSICKPDMWRKWSTQRAGFSESEFEAAEIGEQVSTKDEIFPKNSNAKYAIETDAHISNKEKDNNQIRSRIKDLESQLTSVLHVLRSRRRDRTVSDKDNENPLEELHKLSDAWEFQETEIMHAQDKLRSIRAKLAVLEGKMALAIVEAQKVVELKQQKINDAQKALSLLRTACVVWPNPASEVLLSGSFDGWTSQRRMERSRSGIFSLYLKLYPGRYEIKFIVDGVWMIDPLRPILRNNGYENNLLTVS